MMRWWGRLARNLGEMGIEAAALCRRRYPAFVYGGALEPSIIPVFCYHAADEEDFASDLAYLKENHYVTLSTDEFYGMITRRQPATPRAVLLTFDDGDASVWTTGVPLLARHGMRATVFVIPGRTPGAPLLRPTLEAVWTERLSRTALTNALEDTPGLMTWPEIRAAHASGVLDVQSHSLTHGLVFTGPRLVEFVHPGLMGKLHPHEVPLFHVNGDVATEGLPPLGSPLYRSAPSLATRVRYLEPTAVRQACADYVAGQGGASFFTRAGWRRRLARVERSARRRAGQAVYERPEQRMAAIRRELVESKRQIEAELPGHLVRHLGLPWGYAMTEVPAMAREAGYATVHWLDAPGHRSRGASIGQDPLRVPRLGPAWVRSLPGRPRCHFGRQLVLKCRRRLTEGSAFLTHG